MGTDKLFDMLGRSKVTPPFPAQASGPKLFVIFYLGANYGSVLVAASADKDPKDLAELLEAWQHQKGLNRTVLYSKEEGSAARLSLPGQGRLGATNGTNVVEVGSLLDTFRSAGFDPQAVGSIRSYADVLGAGRPFAQGSTSYYDLRPLSGTKTVTVSVSMMPETPALFFLWLALIPIATLAGFGAAVAMARREDVPIDKRRRLYPKICLVPCFGSIGVHFVCFTGMMFTGALGKFSDLWLGSSRTLTLAPLIVLMPMLIVPFAALTVKTERKLFGPVPGVDKVFPEQTVAGARRAIRGRLLGFFAGIPFLIAYLLITLYVPNRNSAFRLVGPACLFVALFAPQLIGRKATQKAGLVDGGELDLELTERARVLAAKMGVKPVPVRVIRTGPLSSFVVGRTVPTYVSVTQGAVESLTHDEMEFLLAHELGHHKLRSMRLC